MKPNVFLSHSKSDKAFIEKVANDLRNARISVWYDEWEIPVGESFRKKIFEDGISNCDLFLVYLTENSVNSFWVKSELDAAFIRDANSRISSLAIFVNSDEVRSKLPLDVQSLHSPVFNEENYNPPLNQLISRVWEVTLEKRIKSAIDSQRIQFLELEKEKNELQMQLLRIESVGGIDLEKLGNELKNTNHEVLNRGINYSLTMFEIFSILSVQLASGTYFRSMKNTLLKYLKFPIYDLDTFDDTLNMTEMVGKLIVLGIVKVQPATGEYYDTYYLTDLGIKLAREIE